MMMTTTTTTRLLAAIASLLLFASPVIGQHGVSIFDVAESTPEFSILARALRLSGADGLVTCRENCVEVTVFAPSNEAFNALDSELFSKLTSGPWLEHLYQTILYHVVEGFVFSDSIQDGGEVETLLEGSSVSTRFGRLGKIRINEATVFLPDVEAANGVVHGINQVLIPPFLELDIFDVVRGSFRFETLTQAIRRAGLVETLRGMGPFTLMAPSDGAFNRLGQETLDSLSDAELRDILLYHVIPGVTTYDSISEGRAQTALSGAFMNVQFIGNDYRTILNDASEIVEFDILANNGVVHRIDNVLIPPSNQGGGGRRRRRRRGGGGGSDHV